jgi:LysR family transcriptional regulator, regulator for bpeEF and oprC
MKDLNGLRLFLAVAEAQSFTAAGARLGLTPSAVSKAVARLEAEYGQQLLHRTTRRISLSHDGFIFYERCRQLIADLEDAENQLTQTALAPSGRLRVHMPTAFGKRVVLPWLAPLLMQYPRLQLDVELGDRPVDIAEEGLDAAVRFGALPDSSLVARRLCQVRFVACAAPDYLRRYGLPQTPDDLDKHMCLGYTRPSRALYREWPFRHPDGSVQTRAISGRLNVNSAEALLEAAIAGSGIAMVADFVAWPAVKSRQLALVLTDFMAPAVPVSLVYLRARQHAARLRWFVETLQSIASSHAAWEAALDGIQDNTAPL